MEGNKYGFEVGKEYYLRTSIHHYLGKCTKILEGAVVVEKCVWIGDTGRFHKFVAGEFDSNVELEPYPVDREVHVLYESLLDFSEWPYGIPSEAR